jgi:catechol-2,3-dioxygenase
MPLGHLGTWIFSYAAFFRDPDGFMIEVVCHRDRSA